VQEPFVSGADTWIDRVVADIPNAEDGFTLIFSSTPFPGYQYRLDWRRTESDGNWFYSADLDMEGWLCPALFRYFPDAEQWLKLLDRSSDIRAFIAANKTQLKAKDRRLTIFAARLLRLRGTQPHSSAPYRLGG
jgi:hypothetical protein